MLAHHRFVATLALTAAAAFAASANAADPPASPAVAPSSSEPRPVQGQQKATKTRSNIQNNRTGAAPPAGEDHPPAAPGGIGQPPPKATASHMSYGTVKGESKDDAAASPAAEVQPPAPAEAGKSAAEPGKPAP